MLALTSDVQRGDQGDLRATVRLSAQEGVGGLWSAPGSARIKVGDRHLRAERENFSPGDDREAGPASPLLAPIAVLSRQPRTVVVTAGLDPLCDEGAAYVEALRRAGVDAREWRVKGTIHGFVLFAGRIGKGRDIIQRIGQAISGARSGRGRFGLFRS